MIDWHLACCDETCVITFLDFRFCLLCWITCPQNCVLSNISFCVRKKLKNLSNLTWLETVLNPGKWGVISENPEIPWERTVDHVNNMIRRMQYSGYSKGFRYEIVQSALHAYKMIQTLDETGVKPMYRPKEWRQNERRKEKEEKRRSWYRNCLLYTSPSPRDA